MSHASRVADMLRQAEEDDELPEDFRERCAERAEEIEEGDE